MNVRWRSQFKKDYKRMMKQGKDIRKLDCVIEELAVLNPLPEQYRYHYLAYRKFIVPQVIYCGDETGVSKQIEL